MGYQPLTWNLLITGYSHVKTGHFKELSLFEKLYALHLHRKYKSDVYLGTNHIGDRVIRTTTTR